MTEAADIHAWMIPKIPISEIKATVYESRTNEQDKMI